MLKRINLELRGRPPNKMQELDLDGVKCLGEIDFGDLQMDNLEQVTLSRANLTSLKNFPTLPSLVKLDLCHNRLSKGLENLKQCTKLKCLILAGNRFKPSKDLEFLEPLASLPNLTHLELGEKYFNDDDEELNSNKMKPKVFSILPQLQYLDLMDRHGNPEDDNDEDDNEDQHILNGDDDDDEDSDEISDVDDELEEEEDLEDSDDGESEEDERLPYNGANGATQDYNDQGSDAEDEDDDDDEDTETAPVVRGKKRKYDNEDLLQ